MVLIDLKNIVRNWPILDSEKLFGMCAYFITYDDDMFGWGEGVNRFFGYSDVEDRDIMYNKKIDKIGIGKKVEQLKELGVIADDIRRTAYFSESNPNKYKLEVCKTGGQLWCYDEEQLGKLREIFLSLNIGNKIVRISKAENLAKVWLAVLTGMSGYETTSYEWLGEKTGLSRRIIYDNLKLLIDNEILFKKVIWDKKLNQRITFFSDERISAEYIEKYREMRMKIV